MFFSRSWLDVSIEKELLDVRRIKYGCLKTISKYPASIQNPLRSWKVGADCGYLSYPGSINNLEWSFGMFLMPSWWLRKSKATMYIYMYCLEDGNADAHSSMYNWWQELWVCSHWKIREIPLWVCSFFFHSFLTSFFSFLFSSLSKYQFNAKEQNEVSWTVGWKRIVLVCDVWLQHESGLGVVGIWTVLGEAVCLQHGSVCGSNSQPFQRRLSITTVASPAELIVGKQTWGEWWEFGRAVDVWWGWRDECGRGRETKGWV